MKDRPVPLAFPDDDLDFDNHDHHHNRHEAEVFQHVDLRVLSRRGHPAGFFILTGNDERMVDAKPVMAFSPDR
jgi:hypothetical protein